MNDHQNIRIRRSRKMLALALSALVASAGLVSVAAPAAADNPVSINVDLEGTWKFIKGDNPAYATPAYDDSAWLDLTVPEDGAQWASYNGYGWYRLKFTLPTEAAGTNLVASLGFIDDADEAYLNGVKIGSSGRFSPADSQWFEKRLYTVPGNVPVFGGENVIAIKVQDQSGGGGIYRGPLAIYSKDQVRQNVYEIPGGRVSASVEAQVQAVLDVQKAALAAGDVNGYLATLGSSYVHDGRDADRRARELTTWMAASGGTLTLNDGEVEVVQDGNGNLVVDTNRSITGTKNGAPFAFQPTAQTFLQFDPSTLLEVGNHSRFFRENVESVVEGNKLREFVTYLPPSYFDEPNRQYPVVYMLHGINGGSREWEPRDMDDKLDALWAGGLAETIVIMPDGESLWYVDSTAVKWRTMFYTEMMPLVDAEYRTLADPSFRGLSGVSMGGFGAWSIGLESPDKFSSIASHIGAIGSTQGGKPRPYDKVNTMTTEELSHYDFFFDACEFDEYAFDNAARTMATRLTAKNVDFTWAVYPTGTHNDACWVPHLVDSFGVHSAHFRDRGLQEDYVAPVITIDDGDAEATSFGWYNTPVALTVNVTDETDAAPTVEYSLDGGSWTPYVDAVVVGEGEHTLSVRATDAAGNQSEAAATTKVDLGAPVSSAVVSGYSRTVVLDATDALSGVASIEYKIGSGNWTIYSAGFTLGNGATTVAFRATDKAGNVGVANAVAVPAFASLEKSKVKTKLAKTNISVSEVGVVEITVKSDLDAAAVGSVTVKVGSQVLPASQLVNGATVVTLPSLPVGTHTITVTYDASSSLTLLPSEDTIKLKVK
ncbi:MAG: OmpL47-type beta-barrel domain-containing protein [Rhodoglobus sp.]